jgi:hypothetical protein
MTGRWTVTRNERELEAQRLLALRPRAEAELRGIAGVRAIGVGVRSRSGALTGELVFKVYVDAKRSPTELTPDQMVPPDIAGVPTDVVTIGRGRKQCWDKGTRPLRGGLQVAQSPFDLTMESRGTITCIATTHDGKTAVISNEHVLQHRTSPDKTVYQPHYDNCLGFNCNKIGVSTNGVRDHVSFAGTQYFVDCAIVVCDDDIDTRALLRRITNPAGPGNTTVDLPPHVAGTVVVNDGKVVAVRDENEALVDLTRIAGTAIALPGELVYKVGNTTGLTVGVVSDFMGPLVDDVTHEQVNNVVLIDHIAGYSDKDQVPLFSAEGDSGSAIMNLANQVCGVLTGDYSVDNPPPTKHQTFACHIYPVLEQLGATIRISPDPVVPTGARTRDDDEPEPLAEPLHALRAQIADSPNGPRLLGFVERHGREAYDLVLHRRAVTVAWHRHRGAQFAALAARELRNRSQVIPQEADGVPLTSLLRAMAQVLDQCGSAELRTALGADEAWLLALLDGCESIPELLARLSTSASADAPPA